MATLGTPTRFVGRDRELARIATVVEAAAAGRRRRVLISGPTGSGVTRLVDETARRVARLPEPFTVIRCRATAGRSFEPYAPLIAALAPVFAALDDREFARVLGPGARPLVPLLPEIADRAAALGLLSGAPLVVPPERAGAFIAEGVLGVLGRIEQRAPVLFTLEDLHHADAATRALAVFLVRVSRSARLCLLITHHPDQMTREHPLHADLAAMQDHDDPPERIALDPLGRDELADLVAELEGSRPTAALLLLVAERSGGIPLLAEEVLAARRELEGVAPGASLDAIVAARLGDRSPECRRVLRLLAPAESPIAPETLATAAAAYELGSAGLPPRSSTTPRRGSAALDPDLAAGLAEAIEHGFVVETPDGCLAIRHELIGRAIIADLLPGTRRRHRMAMAAGLAGHPALALHALDAARDAAGTRGAAIATAELAEARGAPGDALAALELALELGAADDDDRAAAGHLLVRAGEHALAAGRAGRAVAYLEAAVGRFDERLDRLQVSEIHGALGRASRALGDHKRAITEHERAVALLPPGPSVERAAALAALAQGLMLDGRFGSAERIAGNAITIAGLVGAAARGEAAHATCTLGIVRAWSADPSAATVLLEEAAATARELGRIDDWFRASANLSTALSLLGRREDAIEEAARAVDEVRRDGLEAAYGNALRGNVGEALLLSGRWVDARAMLATALEWSPDPEAFTDAIITLAALEIETASDERSARLLGRLLIELRQAPDPQAEVPASQVAASFALWRGDVADAGRSAELGWSLVRRSEDWLLAARMAATYLEVQAAIARDAHERRDFAGLAGARSRAAEVLAAAEAFVAGSGVPASAATRLEADACIATARAHGARVADQDDAVLWDALARTWERLGAPYQVARARWRQAEAALATSDARTGRRAARRPLREAARIAAELGAGPLLRELAELAHRAMIELPAASPVPTGEPLPASVTEVGVPVVSPRSSRGAGPSGPSAQPIGSAGGDGAAGDSAIARAFSEPGPARKGGAFGLSGRELEVLALVVQGRTNREIGEHLFISQKTVGVHVGNILAKLGASGRVEAAMVAVRLELVPSG